MASDQLTNTTAYLAGQARTGILSPTEADTLLAYLTEYKVLHGPSPHFLAVRGSHLYRILQQLHATTGRSLETASTLDLLRTIDAIRSLPQYKPNYRRAMVQATKVFCDWYAEQRPDLDAAKIRKARLPDGEWKCKGPEDILTKDQVLAVLAACTCTRDRCFVAMVYDGANRPSEVLALTWGAIQVTGETAHFITNAKTGIERYVPLAFALPYLYAWKNEYPGDPAGENPVFVTLNVHQGKHRKMTKRAMDHRIQAIRNKTGIPVMPSIFRPTRTTHDMDDHVPMPFIMLRGWGSLKTRMIDRYTHLDRSYMDRTAREAAGLPVTAKEEVAAARKLQHIVCPHCQQPRLATDAWCTCGEPLSEDAKATFEARLEDAKRDPFYEALKKDLLAELGKRG
ncbi:MAG: tyrosine-type recombinase/integrase [bacterium]